MLRKSQVFLFFPRIILFFFSNFVNFPHFCFFLFSNVSLCSLHILSSLWFFMIISSPSPFIYSTLPTPLFSCSQKHVLRSLQKQQLSWRLWSQSGSRAAWWTKSPPASCSLRGQAWPQPSYICVTADWSLLSSMKTIRTGHLLYQTIFWLSLNPLFIKENKTRVLMSIDEDNKHEPQRKP